MDVDISKRDLVFHDASTVDRRGKHPTLTCFLKNLNPKKIRSVFLSFFLSFFPSNFNPGPFRKHSRVLSPKKGEWSHTQGFCWFCLGSPPQKSPSIGEYQYHPFWLPRTRKTYHKQSKRGNNFPITTFLFLGGHLNLTPKK